MKYLIFLPQTHSQGRQLFWENGIFNEWHWFLVLKFLTNGTNYTLHKNFPYQPDLHGSSWGRWGLCFLPNQSSSFVTESSLCNNMNGRSLHLSFVSLSVSCAPGALQLLQGFVAFKPQKFFSDDWDLLNCNHFHTYMATLPTRWVPCFFKYKQMWIPSTLQWRYRATTYGLDGAFSPSWDQQTAVRLPAFNLISAAVPFWYLTIHDLQMVGVNWFSNLFKNLRPLSVLHQKIGTS